MKVRDLIAGLPDQFLNAETADRYLIVLVPQQGKEALVYSNMHPGWMMEILRSAGGGDISEIEQIAIN